MEQLTQAASFIAWVASNFLLNLAAGWALLMLSALVHEVGHALIASVMGILVSRFVVGVPDAELEHRKPTFHYRGIPCYLGVSKVSGHVELSGNQVGRWKLVVILLAGPLAGSLFVLLATMALLTLVAWHQMFGVLLWGLLALVVNISQLVRQDVGTDGYYIRRLLCDSTYLPTT